MVIRQRRTLMDPILLDVICPFLRARGLDRFLPVGRVWNYVVGSAPDPAPAVLPLRRQPAGLAGGDGGRLSIVTAPVRHLVHHKP